MTYTTHAVALDARSAYQMGQDAKRQGLPRYCGDNPEYMTKRDAKDAPAAWVHAWDRAYHNGWDDGDDTSTH